MSINPPSDIVLDVARAADPTRYAEAAARLTRAAAPADGFSTMMAQSSADAAPAGAPPSSAAMADATKPGAKPPARAEEAYRGFEAMALSTMIEAAMPDESSVIFGKGTAGSVWKSMLAQQLGEQMAKAGGIGLAAQLARGAQAALVNDKVAPQADAGANAQSLLLSAIERRVTGAIMPSAANDDDDGGGDDFDTATGPAA
jgi:Rod binding domain-containing protein